LDISKRNGAEQEHENIDREIENNILENSEWYLKKARLGYAARKTKAARKA
jgi:hypothetical protein